jgi:hypothetical protein
LYIYRNNYLKSTVMSSFCHIEKPITREKTYVVMLVGLVCFAISSFISGIGIGVCGSRHYCSDPSFPYAVHNGNVEHCCSINVEPQVCILNSGNVYHCEDMIYWQVSLYTSIGLIVLWVVTIPLVSCIINCCLLRYPPRKDLSHQEVQASI